jgi:hypothetical protein
MSSLFYRGDLGGVPELTVTKWEAVHPMKSKRVAFTNVRLQVLFILVPATYAP